MNVRVTITQKCQKWKIYVPIVLLCSTVMKIVFISLRMEDALIVFGTEALAIFLNKFYMTVVMPSFFVPFYISFTLDSKV